jgi:hypothetical protein
MFSYLQHNLTKGESNILTNSSSIIVGEVSDSTYYITSAAIIMFAMWAGLNLLVCYFGSIGLFYFPISVGRYDFT